MYKKASTDNCDLVICNFFEDRGNLYGIKFKDFKDTSLKDNPSLINNINLGPCNKLYSLELLKNNNIYNNWQIKVGFWPQQYFVSNYAKNTCAIMKRIRIGD